MEDYELENFLTEEEILAFEEQYEKDCYCDFEYIEEYYTNQYDSLYECIDEFGINMREYLINPIEAGRDKSIVLDECAQKVWNYYLENIEHIRIHGLKGKRKFDKKNQGNWKGDYLKLDILGKHSTLREYLATRLSRFLNMIEENKLIGTLRDLNYIVEKASEYDDRIKKIDLYFLIDNIKFAVRVFKNSEKGREYKEEKIANCKEEINEPIVEFGFDENRQTTNIQHVTAWVQEIKQEYI